VTLPRLAGAIARSRVPTPDHVGPTRFHVSTANGHSDYRKAAGARRYTPGVVCRYQPVVRPRRALPRRPAAPLRWAGLVVTGVQSTRRGVLGAVRGILHLLLDESSTSSRSQRAMTDASIRHNMPIHSLSGYGSSDLN
jgi:hypothetical protein